MMISNPVGRASVRFELKLACFEELDGWHWQYARIVPTRSNYL